LVKNRNSFSLPPECTYLNVEEAAERWGAKKLQGYPWTSNIHPFKRTPNKLRLLRELTDVQVERGTTRRKPWLFCEKSVQMLKEMIVLYTKRGETVWDPCFGTGTTALAAMNVDREFVGSESNEALAEAAAKRIYGFVRVAVGSGFKKERLGEVDYPLIRMQQTREGLDGMKRDNIEETYKTGELSTKSVQDRALAGGYFEIVDQKGVKGAGDRSVGLGARALKDIPTDTVVAKFFGEWSSEEAILRGTSCLLPPTSCLLRPIIPPTSYILQPTSYSYLLLPTSYLLPRGPQGHGEPTAKALPPEGHPLGD